MTIPSRPSSPLPRLDVTADDTAAMTTAELTYC
jgi:hypothetical protein